MMAYIRTLGVSELMTYQEFIANISTMGSDHAIQGVEVDAPAVGTLRGFTHNMLNKMYSVQNCPAQVQHKFTNNPGNFDESNEEYLSRKAAQLQFYISEIDRHIKEGRPYDFAFLQEVDILTRALGDHDSERRRKAIYENFVEQLKARGWALVKTQQKYNCKTMVTLYNAQTLKLVGERRGVLPDGGGNKNTGFESIFAHVKSRRNVILTNLHLDYDKESETYTKEIAKYNGEKSAESALTILGGDTNRPRSTLNGTIGTNEYATSFDSSMKDGDNYNSFTLLHRTTGLISSIDSFIVASPGSYTAKEVDSYYFNDAFKLNAKPVGQPHQANTTSVSQANVAGTTPVTQQSTATNSLSQHVLSQPASFNSGSRTYFAAYDSSPPEAKPKKVSNTDILSAAKMIGLSGQPMVRFENGKHILAIPYGSNSLSQKDVNNALSAFRNNCPNELQRNIKIEAYQFANRSYRAIFLTREQAEGLVNHANSRRTGMSFVR